MSSRADDFDVSHRRAGGDRPWANGGSEGNGGYEGNGANGSYGEQVSYDLGYDAEGWDTQGFRSPVAEYGAVPPPAVPPAAAPTMVGGTAVRAPGQGRSRARSHARPSGPPAGPGGPAGPWGPGGPGGPGGPRGPRNRRRRERTQIKVKGSWWRRWTVRKALGVLGAAIGAFVVLVAAVVVVAYEQTPVPTEAMAATTFSQSVVYSADGTLIGRLGTTNRQMLKLSDIPKVVQDAVLAAEDRNFFTEGGISPTGIARAAYADVRGSDGSLQGGSTITQQFVRNYYAGVGTQQTLSRKIKEIFVAMKVAKEKSKDWILENYLNTIYLGEGAYGIGAAAQTYYHEPVSKLTKAQAAVIAAIIQQPSTYPLPQYRAQLTARWHYVLNGMVQMGDLSAQDAQTMTFPAPGDYEAQSVGSDVWDPYILNMVYKELVKDYHFSKSQIYNGGYVIRTTIDDKLMAALYRAVSQNQAQINAGSSVYNFKSYMHVGAVLQDPTTGAIQALYPGPGFPGSKYNGTGHVITERECMKISCEYNMAVDNREQVGSSFKPYVLATAVKQGMNVKTSTLNGFSPLWIAPDSQPDAYSANSQAAAQYQYHEITNDSPGENGPYTAQMAMAVSINTAFADLWHKVGGASVAQMAQAFGVDTTAAAITGVNGMEHEAGVALGQASLTVGEQATMLSTIADDGVYHNAHVIASIAQPQNNMQTQAKITVYPVFDSADQNLNKEEATQIQYAMSEDTAPYGTAPGAAMSNGQVIIAKTGTTNTAQSAFFIGALPKESLAVALFTSNQTGKGPQTLNNLGGLQQGGFGGTWAASIWHTFAENVFVPMGVEQWEQPTFTGAAWNQVPPNLRKPAKKHDKKKKGNGGGDNNNNQGGGDQGNNPNPYPTYSCDPTVVTCDTGTPGAQNGNAATGAALVGLPGTALWVKRRRHGPDR